MSTHPRDWHLSLWQAHDGHQRLPAVAWLVSPCDPEHPCPGSESLNVSPWDHDGDGPSGASTRAVPPTP